MRSRILGARVIDPASGLDQVRDLYLDGGKLAAFDQAPAGFVADQDIDARGLIASPGLVDLSVALREPGYSRKGNIASETLAAAAGGVTSLCCPPLTKPVLDTPAVAELILDRAQEAGHTKVFPIGALTKNLTGEQLAELVALRDAGCVAFGNGLAPLAGNRNLRRALEYAATFDLTVVFHAQDADLAAGGLAHEGATEPGISSAELLLPLALTLVQDGLLDLPTLLARLTNGPAKALRLPAGRLAVGAPADITLFDAAGQTLAGETWRSKGGNCPFIGHCLPGQVRYTLVDGRISYQS